VTFIAVIASIACNASGIALFLIHGNHYDSQSRRDGQAQAASARGAERALDGGGGAGDSDCVSERRSESRRA